MSLGSPHFPLLDAEFDHYDQHEIDDMISAAKSGSISTANENLYCLHTSKNYMIDPMQRKKRIRIKPPSEAVLLEARDFFTSLLDAHRAKSKKILVEFATNPTNKEMFSRYVKE